ncbi:transposase [Companilactobacillus furfuricola]|uniref:transposase n=1 Tax=Companilactobacillus furfuricola TaxID=1462575 RepID=UPI000F781BC6|nr:transposase [Companilactobacillus furfuricola]
MTELIGDNIDDTEYGKYFFIYKRVEHGNKIVIYLKSKPHETPCPVCGVATRKLAATYHRVMQETPYCNKNVTLDITAYKYYCLNPKCKRNVFCERLPFAGKNQVRTKELCKFILLNSLNTSNNQSSINLSYLGVKIGREAIQKMYDRLHFKDDPNIKSIGVDDISVKKGSKYATMVYNLKTGNQRLCSKDGTENHLDVG